MNNAKTAPCKQKTQGMNFGYNVHVLIVTTVERGFHCDIQWRVNCDNE